MITELRPYQTEAIQAIRSTIAQGVRRIVLQAATGAGKTKIAAAIVDGALRKGNRLAFVVPAISLVDQTVESFWAEGIRDIGVIQSNHGMTDWSQPVQVCSIQTVASRRVFPEAQIVVRDECHTLHKADRDWLTHPDWERTPFIGLSATPWSRGLGKYFQTLLVAATTQDLISQGYLSPFRVFATGHPDLSAVKTVAGDYHEGQLSNAMQDGSLTADIVQTWKTHWGKDKTLCFAVDRAHAQALQKRFEEAGISCGYQDANTTDTERKEIKRKFHNGEYRIVSNIGTLTTGVDWDVRCLILARPTKSEILFTQIIGRALRTAPGKQDALILDHSDTTARLGFVTDIHHEHLSDGKPADKSPTEAKEPSLPKECKSCGVLMPKKLAACPNCGFKPEIESGYIERDGELVEMKPGVVTKQKRGEARVYSMEEKTKFFAELKAYGIAHGRKDGWAAWSFKEKFGIWPDWSIKGVPPAAFAGMEVTMWVKSRNIAYAKSQKKRADESARA